MKNWKRLNNIKSENLWDYVFDNLSFHPLEVKNKKIHIAKPNINFDTFDFFDIENIQVLYDDLHSKFIQIFVEISKGKRVFALDWQHDCYSFDPKLPFEKNKFDQWLIPVFPNGDLCFFFTNDLTNGIFGDGWEHTLTLFGEEIINSFKKNLPILFQNIEFI
jgi:hypothetical protein